jgi:uncharacterized protein (DUF885 family)
MKYFIITLLLLFSLSILHAQLKQDSTNKEISAVMKEIKDFNTIERKKDSAANKPLGSCKEEDFLKQYQFYKKIDQKLKSINNKNLSFQDQINLELIQHDIKDELFTYEFKSYLNPILSDEGFHTALVRRSNTIINSKKDAEQYLVLLNDIPRYVNENLRLIEEGLRLGISQPKIILTGYENTYRRHIVDTIENSTFYKPLITKPNSINAEEWNEIVVKAKSAIITNVIPSFRSIDSFFSAHYFPKTRETLGASHFPNGKAFYEERVKHFTSTNLSSEEVYQIGLKEVARIRDEMNKVMQQVNFKGDFKSFIQFLRTDKQFYATSPEQLLKEAAFISKKADGKLPSLFGKLPRQPYSVEPVPEHLAPTYTSGRYSGAPINSKRAGAYWVNTYDLPSRTLYTLEALTLHEAVPGHHLQIALTQELDLPEFRKNFYVNAFGEGWGLYSEYLGHEMGFYKDPYSLFGRLTYEMWRACRLVIDVGIHTKNWTREQAVNYLADNTALSLHEVNTEINRYISWPGQALAYKIGEIKIKELRKKTEEALKEDFDVRSFHDMILSNGSVTLSILEKMTDRYIKEQLEKKKKKNA